MIEKIFETGIELPPLYIAIRSITMYFVALILLRIGGLRIIGKKTGLDLVIIIILGSILARGILGIASFSLSIVAGTAMVVLNRLLAWLSVKYPLINTLLKGKSIILFTDGKILWENMTKVAISQSELITSLRLETNSDNFDRIKTAYMEPNGRISFILK